MSELSLLKSLESLYLRQILGDKYVESKNIDSEISQDYAFSDNMIENIKNCKLCDISKNVRDSERFCGFYPKDSIKPSIAFVVESLHLNHIDKNLISYDLSNLSKNQANEMLINIIEKVFNLESKNVYILPLFKCAEIGENNNINLSIHTKDLNKERQICAKYVLKELSNVEYAVFFGENLCKEFFKSDIKSVKNSLLELDTSTCICVPEIMQMLANPSLKKEAMISFTLLKNAIKARGNLN